MKRMVFLLVMLKALSICCIAFAQSQEEITLTTYYPAPYGEYNSLSVGTTYTAPADNNLIVEGNVGIGTTAPTRKLEVIGDPESDLAAVYLQHLGGDPAIQFCNKDGNMAQIKYDGDTDGFDFRTNGLTEDETKMLIGDNGNVGIGTTNPLAALDVDVDGSAILIPRKSTANDPTAAQSFNGMIYYNSNANKFRAYENGAWEDLTGGGDTPDYDSGWVEDDANSNHKTTFTFPSSLTELPPKRIEIWFATTNTPSSVYFVPTGHSGAYLNANPYSIEITTTQVIFNIYVAEPMFSVFDGDTGVWTQYNSGYWRMFLWA